MQTDTQPLPLPETQPEIDSAFKKLQQRFSDRYEEIFSNDLADKTVIIVPSLTLDRKILQSVKGAVHYEERMLCLLLLLRMPRTRLVYVTSTPIDHTIIDYYLHLLPGITGYHATQRLKMLSCYDASDLSLTEKILDRPRLLQRIREEIRNPELAHIATFNVTDHEKRLALALDTPVFGCNPDLWYLGSKSGCRQLFKRLGILLPAGYENLKSESDVAEALANLKKERPAVQKAVVKVNDGFSGDGNAVYRYPENANGITDEQVLSDLRTRLKMVAGGVGYDEFMGKFAGMGGIVEEFVPGEAVQSPSVQCRINPHGLPDVLSTHDQLLGGESGQVYLGATFPAHPDYAVEIGAIGAKVSAELQRLGVLGRFAIDFISVKTPEGWAHYAIEINLRKGGTTHPYIMLQFLTGGTYDWQEGKYVMPNGQVRCYFTSDNVEHEKYKGLTPHDLIDIAMYHKLLYDGARQTGVMFHMIGAVSQFGKIGMLCIGETVDEAKQFYDRTIEVLNRECGV
jgi:hypothetical protein